MQNLTVEYGTFSGLFGKVPVYYAGQQPNETSFDWYMLFAVSDDYFVICEAHGNNKTDFETHHKSACAPTQSSDDAKLDGILANKVPLITPRNEDGTPKVSSYKPLANKVTFVTPNWCDKCTWYKGSEYVTDEEATDSGDHTTYHLAHDHIIDTYHARITFEDYLLDANGHTYRVTVKVNGTTKTEQDPHAGSGGDYTINYVLGHIVFLSPQASDAVITATYHYASSSSFTLAPTVGKTLYVDKVEMQFSEDFELRDSAVFQAYGLVDVFAPAYVGAIPSGTKIPLGPPLTYKSVNDFLNDSNKAYPPYPAVGTNWRGMPKSYVFSWDYDVGATPIMSAYGMELRCSLEHDIECGGASVVLAFYCYEE